MQALQDVIEISGTGRSTNVTEELVGERNVAFSNHVQSLFPRSTSWRCRQAVIQLNN